MIKILAVSFHYDEKSTGGAAKSFLNIIKGATITDVGYQFCEFCGIELSFKRETNKLNSKKTLKSQTRRKHCCWLCPSNCKISLLI